jgi:hypothetical protein
MYGTIRHAGYIAIGKKKNRALKRQNPVMTGLAGYPKSLLDK